MQVIVIEPTRKKKYRVAAYCRISTEKTSQMESMENQYSAYLQKIQSHPEWEFAGIYADEGKSGTEAVHRHQFNRLLEDARKRKIDIILVKSS